MYSVAFYGKGGIGKSTVSSNVSFALSSKGKVLHIGCDPKSDSTRILLPGRKQRTVLRAFQEGVGVSFEDVALIGKGGVVCIEAGGPEPGVGCAGRGIITAFDLLKEDIFQSVDPDYRILDVLGDVVCGGFAIPMRSDYSDAIVIVTSGEFMSLYAANNILRGVKALGGDTERVLGIVANLRGLEGERAILERFAELVDIPIISVIPRSGEINDCEKENSPILEMFPESGIADSIEAIADRIERASKGEQRLYRACPVADDELETMVRGQIIEADRKKTRKSCSRSGKHIETCCAAGAVDIGYYVDGMDILLHSPRSCAYIFSSFHDRMYSNDAGLRTFRICPSGEAMHCTEITDSNSIFGGAEILRGKLEEMASRGSTDIMVITTCMAGIIGDDVANICRSFESTHPSVTVVPVLCDGNVRGDMGEGLYMASVAMLRYVDMSVEPSPDHVNILGMSFMKLSYRKKMDALKGLLGLFGLKINCMFIGGCTLEDIRNLRKGSVNLIMSNVRMARDLAEEVRRIAGIDYLDSPAPIGYAGTVEWIRRLASLTGTESRIQHTLFQLESKYSEIIGRYRPILKDKRVAIHCNAPADISWAVDTVLDLGMHIDQISFDQSQGKRPRSYCVGDHGLEVLFPCTDVEAKSRLMDDPPDLVISRSPVLKTLECSHMGLTDGFFALSGIEDLCRKISDEIILGGRSGWEVRP